MVKTLYSILHRSLDLTSKISSFDDEIDNLVLINMFLDGLKCEFEQTNQSIKNYKKKLIKSV